MASKHSKRSASMSMNVYGSSLGCPKKEGTDIPKLTNPYIQYPSSTDVLNNQPRFPLSSRDFCAHPPNITFLESVVKKKTDQNILSPFNTTLENHHVLKTAHHRPMSHGFEFSSHCRFACAT
jgi:hypothetical protein